jgi:hypothetical protein
MSHIKRSRACPMPVPGRAETRRGVRSFFTSIKGTPSARRAVRPLGRDRMRKRERIGYRRTRREDQARAGRERGQLADSGAAACRALTGGSPPVAAPPPGQHARTRRQPVPPQREPDDRDRATRAGPSSSRRAFSRRAKITGKVVRPRFAAGAPPCL